MKLNTVKKIRLYSCQGIILLTSLLAFCSAHAAMTFVSVSGVSNSDLTDLAKPKIYGGFTGGCSIGDNGLETTTCDSCAKATASGPTICNFTNAYDKLKVTFTATTSATGLAASDFYAENGDTKITAPLNAPTLNGGTLTAQLTWAEICKLLGGDGNSCSKSATGEIVIGLKNGSTNESFTVSVATRVETDTTRLTYKSCADGNYNGSTNYGVCSFQAYKGDEKIYVDDLVFTPNYPTSAVVSGLNYNAAVFFYETSEAQDSSADPGLISKLSVKSKHKTILANASTKKLTDNRVRGLENDKRVCIMMGNQDASGVISYFTPITGGDAVKSDTICETPSKVVGLLDDKNCFIATAAFGSSMAPEVESFRKFRNNFLLTNSVGKNFVKFYYKHSPYYANMIAQSEVARSLVRAALWPILIFARLSLVFGVWMTLLFVVLGGVGIYEVYRRFFVATRVRGEL